MVKKTLDDTGWNSCNIKLFWLVFLDISEDESLFKNLLDHWRKTNSEQINLFTSLSI